jgi:hypothetical protein
MAVPERIWVRDLQLVEAILRKAGDFTGADKISMLYTHDGRKAAWLMPGPTLEKVKELIKDAKNNDFVP